MRRLWSISVIPSYNEGTTPCRTISLASARLLPVASLPWRITVVDDGSREEDSRRMQDCVRMSGSQVGFHRLPNKYGQGGRSLCGLESGFRSGMAWIAGRGWFDPSVRGPSSSCPCLQEENAPDGFFASRCKILGRTVHRSWLRHVWRTRICDACCHCNRNPSLRFAMRFQADTANDAYEAIRSRLREKRFAFDVELLIALRQSGARIIEVPIDWHDVPGSKLHFLRDSGQMLAAVIKMRRRGDLTIRR